MLQGERIIPMSTNPRSKITGTFYLTSYTLPTLSREDAIKSVISTINLSKILMETKNFVFRIGDIDVKESAENVFVGLSYSLYFENHFECSVDEYLEPNYFENYYSDMDAEYRYGDEVQVVGREFKANTFKKTKLGWLRVN